MDPIRVSNAGGSGCCGGGVNTWSKGVYALRNSDPRNRHAYTFTSIFPPLRWLMEDWNCTIMLTSGSRNKRHGLWHLYLPNMDLKCINKSIPTSHDYTCVQLTMQPCNIDNFHFSGCEQNNCTLVIPRPAVQHYPFTRLFRSFYVPFLLSSSFFRPFHPAIFPCRHHHICLNVFVHSTLKNFPIVLLHAHFPRQEPIIISCCGNGHPFWHEIPRWKEPARELRY